MPPLVYEGNVKVLFLATAPSDPTAPTAAELTAGVELSTFIPKNGVTFPSGRNMVPTDAINSTFDSEHPGSRSGQLTIVFKKRDAAGDEDAWTTFKDGLVSGAFVFAFENSVAAGEEVDVYVGTSHFPVRDNPSANTEQRFTVVVGVDEEYLASVVAA